MGCPPAVLLQHNETWQSLSHTEITAFVRQNELGKMIQIMTDYGKREFIFPF